MKKRLPEGPLYFLAFLLIASVYFYRIFTEGAVPVFGDGLVWIYPVQLFNAQAGILPPLWNPYMFAGMPFVGLMQSAAFYPPSIVLYAVLSPVHAFNASILIHYALAGYFAFILLKEYGLSRTAAFFGAAVFAFSGFVMSTKQHVAILNSAVWLPLIVYFAERLKKSMSARYAAALSLTVAVQVLAGNFQVCVYTYIVLAVYFAFSLFEIPKGRRLRFSALGALGFALGLLMAFPQIYATKELSGLSMRPMVKETLGYIFTKEFHVYLRTLPSAVFPHLYSRAEFGTLLPVPGDRMIVFTGILPLALAALALIKGFGKSNTVRLWAFVGLLGLALASADDTPFGNLLFHVPVYGMFHAHGRNMLEISLALSVLFATGMDYLLSGRSKAGAALKVLAGVAALAGVSLAATYIVEGQEAAEALTFSNPALFVPLIFFALYAIVLSLYGATRKRLFIAALFALVIVEAYSFGAYHEAGWTEPGELTGKCEEKGYDFIKDASGGEPSRVAWADTETRDQYNVPCGVSGFNSYDQLMFADYAALFDLEPFGFSRYWDYLLVGNSLLSMMNVKYIMLPRSSELRLDDIQTVAGEARPEAVAAWPGPFYLPDPKNRNNNRMSFKVQLEEGAYAVALKAAPRSAAKASLRMEAYRKEQAELRDDRLPFNTYPGVIREGRENYYRIYLSEGKDTAALSFTSPQKQDVEIRDIAVFRLDGYGPPPISTSGRIYERVRETDGYDVYLNKNALPRAYSVTGLLGARDIYEIKEMFDFNRANPATHAVLLDEDLKQLGKAEFAKADVSVADYKNEQVILRTNSDGESFVVLADQYYPGWRARIDGREARIWKTNGVLRGVVVPAGKHEVVFKYSPLWLKVSILAALAAAAAALFFIYATRKEEEA